VTKVADIGRVLRLDELQILKANGIDAMAPYIDPYNPKGATEQYLRDIYASGLLLAFFFFQTTGGSGNPGYFTVQQGQIDSVAANVFLRKMKALGLVPAVSDVLYAADINLNPPGLFDPYANGIDPNSGGNADPTVQAPGVYGYQSLCDYARTNYPFMGKHLVQTYGRQNGVLEAWQNLQVTIEGITIDIDDSTVPGWRPGPVPDTFWGRDDSTALTLGDLRTYARRLQAQLDLTYALK
jgi:hypothetical protein